MARNTKARLLTIFCFALVVRALFLGWSATGYAFLPDTTLSAVYFVQGHGIAQGAGYNRTIAVSGPIGRITPEVLGFLPHVAIQVDGTRAVVPELFHPPGLPLLVAAFELLGRNVPLAIQILGLVLDCVSAVLVFWVASTFVGEMVGFFTGILYAVFPPLAYMSIAKEPETFVTFFVVGSFACLLQGTRNSGRRAFAWFALSGTALGLGCYFRPDFLLMPWLLLFGLWAFTGNLRRSVLTIAGMQLAALLVLLPWAHRNHDLTGQWIFTSSGVGAASVTGLAEFRNPWGFGATDEDRSRQAAAEGIANWTVPAADRYFKNLFVESILEKPLAYLETVARRVPLAIATPFSWGVDNPWKLRSFAAAREHGGDRYDVLLANPLYVLGAYWDYLAMAGFTLLCSGSVLFMLVAERRHGLVLMLLCPHLYAVLSHMATHIEPRFLVSTMFCGLIGFAYVLARLVSSRSISEHARVLAAS